MLLTFIVFSKKIAYWIKKILNVLSFFGLYPHKFLINLKNLPGFYIDLFQFRKLSKSQNSDFSIIKINAHLQDKGKEGGDFPLHYFWQDLVVAQKIFNKSPVKHVDIGSRIDGFVTHIAAFREIELFDIRPCDIKIPNVIFTQIDILNLPDHLKNYCDSISSLHVIEHIGLGRYGDNIQAEGYLLGLNSIYQILRQGGSFYFSVPIGPQRVEFNAHRVFGLKNLMQLVTQRYEIADFSYIDDKNRLFKSIGLTSENIENNLGCNYGCGIFELVKI